MLFSSVEFIFYFLPVTVIVFFVLQRFSEPIISRGWLLLCSLFFYSWWNPAYLPLMLGSIGGNFALGSGICRTKSPRARKCLFLTGLVANLMLLGFFKYLDFLIINVNGVFSSGIPLQHILLPLGISFFTLQQVAFLVDAYEGLVEEKSLVDYGLFVSFFPQLIAGPIVHHSEMMPQFKKQLTFDASRCVQGLVLFTIGFSKKILLADTFGVWVRTVFDAGHRSFFEVWAGSYCYAFQLYFDFSGYVDMAMGAALILGIRLPINFRSPYRALTVIEFWQRWHITLTNFITTYLYTPILRSFAKVTFKKAMFATVLSMTIAGLWHGASWIFVLFGLIQGVGLAVNNYRQKKKCKKLPVFFAWLFNFHFIVATLVVFRCPNLEVLGAIGHGFRGSYGVVLPEVLAGKISWLTHPAITYGDGLSALGGSLWTLVMMALALLIIFRSKPSQEMVDEFRPTVWNGIWYGLLFILCVLKLGSPSEFLYFQF